MFPALATTHQFPSALTQRVLWRWSEARAQFLKKFDNLEQTPKDQTKVENVLVSASE
jgi:hypothetical protein